MKKMLQRGFTLIELLVVIAIIGILAAVVLASLNDARDSGSQASAKGSMTSVRNQAELYYNANGYTYDETPATAGTTDGACDDGDVTNLLTAAGSAVTATALCNAVGGAYAAQVQLDTTDANSFFCVDSTGYAGTQATKETVVGAAATSCQP